MLSESDRVQADPLVYTDFTVLRGRGDWESRPWAGAPSRSTARHTWNRAPDRLAAMKLSPRDRLCVPSAARPTGYEVPRHAPWAAVSRVWGPWRT